MIKYSIDDLKEIIANFNPNYPFFETQLTVDLLKQLIYVMGLNGDLETSHREVWKLLKNKSDAQIEVIKDFLSTKCTDTD